MQLESLEGTGLLKLNGTSVAKEIHLTGSLICQNGEIGSLDIIGEANLTETKILHASTIMGSFQATRCQMEEPLTLLTQRAVFTGVKLTGIEVKRDSAYKGKQIIELRQKTLVDGPIHFESGKGEVLLYTGSQVLGPITGGKIIKKG